MSAKLSTKTMLTLAAAATFGAAALAPTSASALSRASMQMMSQMVKGRSDDQKSPGYCGYPPCPRPNPTFVRPGNRANAVFGN